MSFMRLRVGQAMGAGRTRADRAGAWLAEFSIGLGRGCGWLVEV